MVAGMPRANRLRVDGGVFHLTNRCNNGAFLLKFARRRYRLVDEDRLCSHLGAYNMEEVRKNPIASLIERIARDEMKRESCWTASLALGSLGFVEKVKPLILSRRETEIVPTTDNAWVLQEPVIAYGRETYLKNASKAIK